MTDPIHIITGSDDGYAIGVAGLIASVGRTNVNTRIDVLSLGISPQNQERLSAIGAALNTPVRITPVERSAVAQLQVRRKHITSATFLRLLIPTLFPDAQKLLYLDCDMSVTGDLRPLFDTDLGDHLIGAVHEPPSLSGPPPGEINAGMLLMNIPAWIHESVAQSCMALLSDPESTLGFEDQSAINMICKDRIALLPPIWNTHAAYGLRQDHLYAAPRDLRILHYVGDIKPWNARTTFSRIWAAPFEGLGLALPDQPPVPLARRLSRTNLKRREMMERLTRTPLGQAQTRLTQAVAQQIEPALLPRLRG